MKEVIIIGAGIAGISSAMFLIENGFKVTVIESKQHIGGRCFSFYDKTIGLEIDNGQHIFAGLYTNFFQLIKWLGSSNLFKYNKSLKIEFINKNTENFIFNCNVLPGKIGTLFGLFNLKSLSIKDKINIRKVVFSKNNYYENDISILEFLQQKKQSKNCIKYFWEPIVLATLNTNIENSSTNLFLTVLDKFIFGKDKEKNLVFSTTNFNNIFSNFSKNLEKNNSKLILGKKVIELLAEQNKCYGIMLNDRHIIKADYIISTIPNNEIYKLIPSIINNYFDYSTIISIYLLFDKIVMNKEFFCAIDTNIQWVFNKKIIDNNKQLLAITISAASKELENLSNNELIKIILEELNLLIPETKKAAICSYRILRDKKATILINNKNNKLRNSTKTNISNLFLAGTWTNTKLPATIEGAALSAKLAAEEIIKLY